MIEAIIVVLHCLVLRGCSLVGLHVTEREEFPLEAAFGCETVDRRGICLQNFYDQSAIVSPLPSVCTGLALCSKCGALIGYWTCFTAVKPANVSKLLRMT